jgi:hypothetical protein
MIIDSKAREIIETWVVRGRHQRKLFYYEIVTKHTTKIVTIKQYCDTILSW